MKLQYPTAKSHIFGISQRTAIITAAMIGVIVTIDLLATRQVIPLDNTSEPLLFIATIVIGYGLGSLILFGYTHRITRDVRKKSVLINTLHITTWVVQFSLLGLLIVVALANKTGLMTASVYAISSFSACFIMAVVSVKFFSWFNSSNKNKIILIFGLTSATLALSIAVDAGTKLFIVQIVEEPTPEGTPTQSSFVYKVEKEGKVQYKEVGPVFTKVFYVPNGNIELYHYLNLIPITISFILRWLGCTLLLHHYYNRKAGLAIIIWVILFLPLILYLIGKVPDMLDLPSDYPYRYYFRILFRIGTIGGSVLFGLAFYVIARTINSQKVKDYLATTAMGITLVGVSLSTSALQQTYGVAAHSLVLLSSYLFGIGLYCSALSVVHDFSLRQAIRNSMVDFLKGISAAEMGQKVRTQALKVAMIRSDHLTSVTGITPSLTENQLKEYVDTVLKEEAGVLENMDEIIKKEKEILRNSVEYSFCSKDAVLELAYGKYFDIFEEVMERKRRGRHIGIQCVTTINQENVALVRKFYDLGVRIRHVKNLPPIDFAFSDKEMIATIEKFKEGSTIKNLLISNEPVYIQHFKSFFEELWNTGIDSEIRMKSISEGLDSEGIEIIQDPQKVQEIGNSLAKSAKDDIVIIFSTNNAFHRQRRVGAFALLERAASLGVKVRMLTPFDNEIASIAARTNEQFIQADGGRNFQIRPIEPSLQTKVSILVSDKKYSLTVELKDDSQISSYEAMGLGTFSNSKSTVLSYVSIFESLWKLSEINEKLKVQDELQKEFINIAAHELRTPIQPIIGLSQVLELDVDEEERHLITSTIIKNANRLQRLTENLLDIAKIEAQALQLKLEWFNLGEIISGIVTDYMKQVKDDDAGSGSGSGSGSVNISCHVDDDIMVRADKDRISQVVYNLISNAMKFTKSGCITISVMDQDKEFILVEVKDTGKGIDPVVLPDLFTKFVTKGDKGTGLGLYISKGIVEAHGGKIGGENNKEGKGARFFFSIPRQKGLMRQDASKSNQLEAAKQVLS